MGTAEKQTASWLKDKWITVAGWLVCLGVTYGSYAINTKWTEERIRRLEEINPAKTQWQVDQSMARLDKVDAEGKITQSQISDIKAQINTMSGKLDMILEQLKKSNR
jgi:hypothetical protein